jgi:hypothetical protein
MTDKKTWFLAGADVIALSEHKLATLQEQIDASRDLPTSPALDDATAAAA